MINHSRVSNVVGAGGGHPLVLLAGTQVWEWQSQAGVAGMAAWKLKRQDQTFPLQHTGEGKVC